MNLPLNIRKISLVLVVTSLAFLFAETLFLKPSEAATSNKSSVCITEWGIREEIVIPRCIKQLESKGFEIISVTPYVDGTHEGPKFVVLGKK